MEEESITISIQEDNGSLRQLEVPLGLSMSLMEILKANGEPIEATCGGMALCATCHIEVLQDNYVGEHSEDELDMLDTLPNATDNSRLACQVQVNKELDGIIIKLMGELVS